MAELSPTDGAPPQRSRWSERLTRLRSGADVAELRARLEELEAEVQECRKLNLRVAELTDLVTELLIPIAQQDPERVDELLARYTAGLG